MMTTDQSEIITFLSRPEAFGRKGAVDRVETHISHVFLCGERVLKLKKAVRYPYLDFSSLERRKTLCEAEVAINRRTAPSLYKGIVAVTREEDGCLTLNGTGKVIDWLVEMSRFEEETLFDRLAKSGGLDRRLMAGLAQSTAQFHAAAEARTGTDTVKALRGTIDGNATSFMELTGGAFSSDEIASITNRSHEKLDALFGLLKVRQGSGKVRHCHGDLHLRNICLLDGVPTLFDAIEFNDAFADIDVFYDLAFLLMDLDYRGLRRLANIVLNRYLDVTDDVEGLSCLPLFLSLRAAIRAHIGATISVGEEDREKARKGLGEARTYFQHAKNYLTPTQPVLLAVGGLSGSGKSRMAREIACHVGAAPGARVARSDVLRKRLAGVDELTKLDQTGYSRDMTERTYQAMYDDVRRAIECGHSAIADAVFAKSEQRRAVSEIATELGVSFYGLWLQAPEDVMVERVTKRKGNASDADAKIVRQQLSYDLGPMEWTCIDSSGPREATLTAGLSAIGLV